MRSVCIDGFNLSLKAGTGIATYGRGLLECVADQGLETQVLYGPDRPTRAEPLAMEAGIAGDSSPRLLRPSERITRAATTYLSQFGRTAVSVRPWGEVLWPEGAPADVLWSSRALYDRARRCFRRHGALTPVRFSSQGASIPSVMHWTTPHPLLARGVPNICTIHDLIPLRLPYTTLHDRDAFLKLHQRIARYSDLIVTVSDTTREDVIRILKVPEDRVVNTYQTANMPAEATARPQDEVATELDRVLGLPWKGYFLHFGAIEPKKNLGRLTQAYLLSGSTTPLVVVGAPGWLHRPETALLDQVERENHPAAGRIRRLDYLSRAMMIGLIRGARAVLFPSLYEGFGLPVLEAMTLSTAVLTSNAGALAETAGDAALTVDPMDPQDIARGIRVLDADDALVLDLQRKGAHQAALFSPQRYRERLAGVYARF